MTTGPGSNFLTTYRTMKNEKVKSKTEARKVFRNAVFKRDKHKCVMCGRSDVKIDAHHIIDRKELPNGGYVLENGITLCDTENGCHRKAEQFHATGKAYPGYSQEDLFKKIGSNLTEAVAASVKLIVP